jgi:hypothetical protein
LLAGVNAGDGDVDGNVTFQGCSFKSLAAAYRDVTNPNVDINNPTSNSVFVEFARGLKFTECSFYGPAKVGFNSVLCETQNVDVIQEFVACKFREEDGLYTYYDWRFTDFTNQVAPAMVRSNRIAGTVFDQCEFISNCRARFLDIRGANTPTECTQCVNDVIINDCVFQNTGLWAGPQASPLSMFSLLNPAGSTSWYNSPILLPRRIRQQDPPGILDDATWRYDINLDSYSLSSCRDLLAFQRTYTIDVTPVAALAYFAQHPCLPVFPTPNTPREVIGCQAIFPLRQDVEEYPCTKRVKSNWAALAQGTIPAVVSNGTLSVQLPAATQVGQARIYDTMGKLAGQASVRPGANEISVHHLAGGSYILQWEGATAPVRFVVTP